MTNIVQSFEKPFHQMGKHRKRCRFCGKLIQDGEMAIFQKMVTEKYYPIKGIQKFQKWTAIHKECERLN